ncbi:hypothetical protein AVEN_82464-1 [Araneus ventricosus]|uniref:Uncharacterized protein n=1 Tax=Araneus ventricosus TaxID=182803 RepID=A0A4Y2CIA4_ARAVE|nr:hypothetical protein AVEN_82464-1 [Araneus ventricosus]
MKKNCANISSERLYRNPTKTFNPLPVSDVIRRVVTKCIVVIETGELLKAPIYRSERVSKEISEDVSRFPAACSVVRHWKFSRCSLIWCLAQEIQHHSPKAGKLSGLKKQNCPSPFHPVMHTVIKLMNQSVNCRAIRRGKRYLRIIFAS